MNVENGQMKTLLMTLLISTVLFSCSKNSKEIQTLNACESSNPLEEVPWLKEMKNSLTQCGCEMSLIQGTYKEQTVFYIVLTDPVCDGISEPTLFDCKGKVVRTFTIDDYRDFYTDVSTVKVLYRCKNSK